MISALPSNHSCIQQTFIECLYYALSWDSATNKSSGPLESGGISKEVRQ